MRGNGRTRVFARGSIAVMAMLSVSVLEVQAEVIQVWIVARAAPSTVGNADAIPDKIPTACIGATIYAEVWVTNIGPGATGVTGGTVDITFFPSLVTAIGVDHGAVFTEFPTGAVDSLVGLVDDVGGNTLDAGVAVAPAWALLASVEFQAIELGDAVFRLQPGAFRFAVSGGSPPLEFGTDVTLGPDCTVTIGTATLSGDMNCNASVGLTDFSSLLPCLSGPGVAVQACDPALADLDADGDTDMKDFAKLQINFTGGE